MTDFKALAYRYFRGEISSDEEKALFVWIREEEGNYALLHRWEEEWKASEMPVSDDSWNRMLGRIAVKQVLDDSDRRLEKKTPVWRYAAAAAAAVLLVAGLFVFSVPKEPRLYAMEAPAGEKCRMVLPDSTVVWLNSGSKLTVDDAFNRKERNVRLTGEGYFEVAHNPDRPFLVDCGEASVLVKGTKFNVSAYPEDRYITTSVVEGHVVFSHDRAYVDLRKGQSARFDVLSKGFSRSSENPENVCAWTESRFIYDNINLSELAEKLSRTYAVKFHFNTTEHLNDLFSISLRNNESLSDVLSALEKIIPVRTRIVGDDVYIEKR